MYNNSSTYSDIFVASCILHEPLFILKRDTMTLHQTAELAHKSLKTSIILCVVGITLLIMFRIGIIIRQILYPPPPDIPNTKYGKLKAIPFPESKVSGEFTYVLDTIDGILPVFPDRIKVYKMKQPQVTLVNISQARDKVKGIGFIDKPDAQYKETEKSEIEYQWEVVIDNLQKVINMDIETFSFQFRTSYKSSPDLLNQIYKNENQATSLGYSMLAAMRYGFSDIDNTKTRVEYLALQDGNLTPVSTFDQSQLIRVDLFQKSIDEIGVYYPDYPHSPINFYIISRGSGLNDIVEANVSHQEVIIDKDNPKTGEKVATYPIKTAEEAYNELQQGKAYIPSYLGSSKQIKVTKVLLGYYIASDRQEYLIPIIVFEGSDNFFAFVPALRNEWIE